MQLTGEMLIGASAVRGTDKPVQAIEAQTGKPMEPRYGGGSAADVDRACDLAWAAFDTYRETSLEDRARFLEAIASNIMEIDWQPDTGTFTMKEATMNVGGATFKLGGVFVLGYDELYGPTVAISLSGRDIEVPDAGTGEVARIFDTLSFVE